MSGHFYEFAVAAGNKPNIGVRDRLSVLKALSENECMDNLPCQSWPMLLRETVLKTDISLTKKGSLLAIRHAYLVATIRLSLSLSVQRTDLQ